MIYCTYTRFEFIASRNKHRQAKAHNGEVGEKEAIAREEAVKGERKRKPFLLTTSTWIPSIVDTSVPPLSTNKANASSWWVKRFSIWWTAESTGVNISLRSKLLTWTNGKVTLVTSYSPLSPSHSNTGFIKYFSAFNSSASFNYTTDQDQVNFVSGDTHKAGHRSCQTGKMFKGERSGWHWSCKLEV